MGVPWSHRSIPLGAHDAPDRVLIREAVRREREVDALVASFDRIVAQGTAELVLVSCYSGIGKSSVVNELHARELDAVRDRFAYNAKMNLSHPLFITELRSYSIATNRYLD
jgi:hypothetical protein